MTKNKEKDSSIVRIEMSQADYDIMSNHMKQLQEILARVRVVKDNSPVALVKPVEPTNPVASAESVAKPKKAPVVKEQLTDDVQKRLFGVNYNNVGIYNNETQTLLAKECNGVKVFWYNDDTTNSKKLKYIFDAATPKFELVAHVNMRVSGANYPGNAKWSSGPIDFDNDGKCIVGNLVVRNKKTGKLKLLEAHAWFGVKRHRGVASAVQSSAGQLPRSVVWNPDFRWTLFAGRKHR